MSNNERLIAEVGGSMAIEGMALTAADKDRMKRYLKNPEEFGRIMAELIGKYKTKAAHKA